jgi:hypothetical protein
VLVTTRDDRGNLEREENRVFLLHTLDTFPGASGGPILAFFPTEGFCIVGLVSKGLRKYFADPNLNHDVANYAVSSSAFAEAVRSIKRHRGVGYDSEITARGAEEFLKQYYGKKDLISYFKEEIRAVERAWTVEESTRQVTAEVREHFLDNPGFPLGPYGDRARESLRTYIDDRKRTLVPYLERMDFLETAYRGALFDYDFLRGTKEYDEILVELESVRKGVTREKDWELRAELFIVLLEIQKSHFGRAIELRMEGGSGQEAIRHVRYAIDAVEDSNVLRDETGLFSFRWTRVVPDLDGWLQRINEINEEIYLLAQELERLN